MRSAAFCLLLLATACGGGAANAPQTYRPSDVTELATLPPGYSAGELRRVGCVKAPRAGGFAEEQLGNVDCTFARLSRVLRANAGELSARFIVGKQCHARGGERALLECSARVARAGTSVGLTVQPDALDAGPAPSAAQVLDLDEPRPQDEEEIRVTFVPARADQRTSFAARSYDAVAETHLASVGRRELGLVSARCTGCDAAFLRYALRVTAGHIGAGEVTGVKCFQDDGDERCVATALEPWSS